MINACERFLARRATVDTIATVRPRLQLAACAALVLVSSFGSSFAENLDPTEAQLAKTFVDEETREADFPFNRVNTTRGSKKVFIHYFPPLPISIDNEPAALDYWNNQYLRASGENNKFISQGGYVRQRPLPRTPWKSVRWREIDALVDVLRAKKIGADGFGIDIIGTKDNSYWQQARRLCEAADIAGDSFSIVLEIDGVSFASARVEQVVDAVSAFSGCRSLYRLSDGRILIVPFAAEVKPPSFWSAVEKSLSTRGLAIALIPDFLDPGKASSEYALQSHCLSAWGGRDPRSVVLNAVKRFVLSSSQNTRCWMQPIAPQDARPKSLIFWEASNTELLRQSWLQAITDDVEYVHLLTWNDYGEATQFAPSSGTQFAIYDLSAFYLQWFKTSRQPKIERDAIYYSHRTQIVDPDTSSLTKIGQFKLVGATPLANDVEMIAMLTAPSKLTIELNDQITSAYVPEGVQLLRMHAQPGRPVFSITRAENVVVRKVSDWEIESNPSKLDPDYHGGSSTRAFQPPP